MSLGFKGTLNLDEYEEKRRGFANLPAGQYIAVLTSFRQFEPKGERPLGRFVFGFKTDANGNDKEFANKMAQQTLSYHPDPENSDNPDGYSQMNDITYQGLIRVNELSGVEPVWAAVPETDQKSIDVIATAKAAAAARPTLGIIIEHREDPSGRRDVDGKVRVFIGVSSVFDPTQ